MCVWGQKTNKFKEKTFVVEEARIVTKTKNVTHGEQSKQALYFIAALLG